MKFWEMNKKWIMKCMRDIREVIAKQPQNAWETLGSNRGKQLWTCIHVDTCIHKHTHLSTHKTRTHRNHAHGKWYNKNQLHMQARFSPTGVCTRGQDRILNPHCPQKWTPWIKGIQWKSHTKAEENLLHVHVSSFQSISNLFFKQYFDSWPGSKSSSPHRHVFPSVSHTFFFSWKESFFSMKGENLRSIVVIFVFCLLPKDK